MPEAKGKSKKHPYDGMVCNPSPENLPTMEDGTCYHCRKVTKTKRVEIPFVRFGRDVGMASEQKRAFVSAPLCATCRKTPRVGLKCNPSQAELAKAAAEFRAWDRKAQRFAAKKKAGRA